jgi:hypothetical protein
MDKLKIKMIEQLNNVVAQAEKIVTAENFSDSSSFNLMREETEKLIEVTNEFKYAVFPNNDDIKSNIFSLKNTLSQLQQKVATCRTDEIGEISVEPTAAVEPAAADAPMMLSEQFHSEHYETINTEMAVAESVTDVKTEQPILDFTTEETPVPENISVGEAAPVKEAEEAAKAVEVESARTEGTPYLLDRLRLLSEEGKSENTSALRAMIDKLRTTPPMPEVHLEHPVDLRTSVGINEKFLFVNELFGGSIRECNEAMAFLNDLDDLDSAMEQMRIYREKFGWNEDSIAYMTLVEVVDQRFGQLVPA